MKQHLNINVKMKNTLAASAVRLALSAPVALLGLAGFGLTGLAVSTSAMAATNITVNAASLHKCLSQYASQANVYISINAELTRGKTCQALQGKYDIVQGFTQLLQGTDLVVVHQGGKNYSLQQQKNTAKVMTLATTQVTDAKSAQDKKSYTAESMRSATGLSLSLRETPQSVTVITRQIMDDFALDTVDAVLANTTGININRAETDRAFPTARGFAIDYIQVDGVSSEANGMMNSDLLADTAIYERVEVVRGAAGILSGAGNPSATINLIRKRPTQEFQSYIKASAGSWDAGRIEGDISGSLTDNGAIRGRLVAAYNSTDSYINFYGNDRTVIYGIAELDITDNTVVTAGIDYQKEDIDGSTYGEPVPFFYDNGTVTDFAQSTTTGAPWTYKDKERSTFFADISHDFDNGWQVKAATSRLKDTMESYLIYLYGYINKDTGAGLSGFTNPMESDRDITSYNLSTNGNFSLFGREHELLLGWNQTTEKISRINYVTPAVAVDNFFQWPVDYPGVSNVIDNDWGWENKQSGAYLSSRWSLTDPITLLLGTRLSNWDTEKWDDGVKGEGYKHNNVLTPYFGLVYDLNDNFSLYTSYTEIFKPQNNKDRQDKFLAPEDGINIEAGIKGEFFNGNLNSSFALFQVEKNNVAKDDIMVDKEQRYKAVEGVQVKGFEAELSGELFTGLNINAGYTYREAEEQDDNGNTVISTTIEPKHMLRINGNYQFSGALEDLAIGATLRWQSKIYAQNKGPNDEDAKQAAVAVTDLMARYQITDEISAKINVNNIFDKKYYSSVPRYNAGYYGAPRNIMLSISASF